MTEPKSDSQVAAEHAGLDSFDALREVVGSTLMSDDEFLASVDPVGPDEDDGDPGDEAQVLADQMPEQAQDAESKLKATKEGIEKAEEGEAGDTTAKSDAVKPEDEAVYEESLRALRRIHAPSKTLSGLSREEVIAWAAPLLKVQADTDRAYTELQQLRSRAVSEDVEKPARDATNAPKTEAIAQADLSKLSEALGLDEEGGAVLRQGLESIVAPLAASIEERDQRDSRRDAAVARLMLKDAAAELADRFPQLKDQAKLSQLAPKVIANINSGAYDSMSAALEDAAKSAFYDELLAAQAQATEKKALARARGRMSAPSQRPKSAASLSIEERLDAVLAGLDAGETEAEIRARSGW